MTDRDKIELPPLPPIAGMPTISAWIDELRIAAVLADRERRAEPEKPAKPEAHRARLILSPKGYAWTAGVVGKGCFTANIRWTDDGRVWIDSERNRELAQWLRSWRGQVGNEAADALDGGVR